MEEITQTHLIGSSYYTWVQTEAWAISGCFQNRTEVLGPGGGRGCGRAGRAIFFLCLGTKQLSQGCSPKQSWLPLPSSTSLPDMWTTTSGKKTQVQTDYKLSFAFNAEPPAGQTPWGEQHLPRSCGEKPTGGTPDQEVFPVYLSVSQSGTPATILSTGVNTWASAVGQALF